jgi:hypothetical protein
MCAPTPLGSANLRLPTSGLRKLRALNRAGAAHNRALVARAIFDSIARTPLGGASAQRQVGRRGNGPTGEALEGSRRKPETRSGEKGVRVRLVLESPTGRTRKRRAQRVPHRWAAEVAATPQGAEGDWKPRHHPDNGWVAGQLKPVTAGGNPAMRKADAGCASSAFGRVSSRSQPRAAESGATPMRPRLGTTKGNTPARRMYGLANAGSSQGSGWQPLWFLEPGNGPRFRALADPGRCPRGRRAGDWASRLEDGRTRTREVGLRPSEGQHPAESPEQARSPRGDRRRYLARGQCRR